MPELASRQHVRDICGVVERALADGGAGWPDVDALAVTQGPGLVGSLLVGVSFAKAAAWAARQAARRGQSPRRPSSSRSGSSTAPIALPAIVLVVSGGHTSLYLVERPGEYQLLGRTRDDAAGEAYDKVAKLLSLGYPGGPDHRSPVRRKGTTTAIRWPGTRFDQPGPQRARARRALRLQLQRASRPPCCATCGNGRRNWASTNCRTRRSSTSPRAFSARRRHADRSRVRGGALARREIDRHRRRRVGQLCACDRTRSRKRSAARSRSTFRGCRSRPTTPR